FTVDWEKNYGAWRQDPDRADYGGIIKGTSALCDLLDQLSIPCTWFVECHATDSHLNAPSVCADQFERLKQRPQDELAPHIHWGDYANSAGQPVDLYDRQWVFETLEAVTRDLTLAGGRSPTAFRSGGHIAAPC